MTVIIVGVSLMLGLFAADSGWFDTRPHYYSHTYETKEQCEAVREKLAEELLFPEIHRKGTVCTDKHALYITK